MRSILSAMLLILSCLLLPVTASASGGFIPPMLKDYDFLHRENCGDPKRWQETGRKILREHPDLPARIMNQLEPALDQVLQREMTQADDVQPTDPAIDFQQVRSSYKGLSCLGIALGAEGRHPEARASIRCAVKLSVAVTRVAFGGPVSLINQMIGIAGINVSMLAAHQYIYRYAPDAQSVNSLAREIARLRELMAPFAFCIEYEHKNMLKVIDNLKNDSSIIQKNKPLAASMVNQIKAYYDADVWKVFQKTIDLSNQPFYETDEGFRQLHEEMEALIASTHVPWYKAWWDPAWAVSRILISIAVPNFERAVHQQVRSDTLLAATTVAAGARLFHLKNRYWPEKMADLEAIPDLPYPTDPCSGKPWVFKRKGRGLQLYSLGWDREDNHNGGQIDEHGDDFNVFDAWGEQ